jgi:hypothetical protein
MQLLKNILFSFGLIISLSSSAQNVMPFTDIGGYFKTLNGKSFSTIEYQRVKEYKVGDEMVGYIDTRGNLNVYNGVEKQVLTNIETSFEMSDHLLVWKIGTTINLWDAGELQTLTYYGGQFQITDSLVVFEDLRYNCVNVYSRGKIKTLYTVVDDLYMPPLIGDNILAFKDNGNIYKIFWNDSIFELGAWNGAITFSSGTNVLTLNDPTTRTYTVFDKGTFIDLNQNFVTRYQAGRNFVVFEDLNGNLNHYKDGKITEISNFKADSWKVKDDIVTWSENGQFFVFMNNEKHLISPFMPSDYKVKNNTLVFRNAMGGVSVFENGKAVTLTNQLNATYEIYGNSVIVMLFNTSFLFYQQGEIMNY